MNLALAIARRYLFSRKSTQVINIISMITAFAMAVGTAALIIVMSVFNGFEGLIKSLYKVFYPDVLILPAEGKFFEPEAALLNRLKDNKDIIAYTTVLQENVLAEYNSRQYIATIKGVDDQYYNVVDELDNYMFEGNKSLGSGEAPFAVVGAGVAYTLGLSTTNPLGYLTLYMPRSDKKSLTDVANAFRRQEIYPGGIFAVQQDFDSKLIIVPIQFARDLMGENQFLSAIEIKTAPNKADQVRDQLQETLGKQWIIKNRFQQNETLYKVMQTEKWVVFALLSFIILIAAFNIIGSLSMLVLEKQKDIGTLTALGANKSLITRIFMLEGMMMSLLGAGTGMFIALIICLVQQYIGVIEMPGQTFVVKYYPVKIMLTDFLLVGIIVVVISMLMAWLPARRAVKNFMDLRIR